MNVDHSATAQAVAEAHPPAKTVEGAFAFLQQLLAALPEGERAGYVKAPAGGENVATLEDGTPVRVARVCYPDGQLYKVLSDVPTTNGPQWVDNGTVDPSQYVRFWPPVSHPLPVGDEPHPAPVVAPDGRLDTLIGLLADVQRRLAVIENNQLIALASLRDAKPAPEYEGKILGIPVVLHPRS